MSEVCGAQSGAPHPKETNPAETGRVSRQEFSLPSSDGKTTLKGDLWLPAGAAGDGGSPGGPTSDLATDPVRAVVQIVHGMTEHIGRYDAFARYLAARGYAVAGHDHLGHGRSVDSRESWGVLEPNAGAEHLLEDVGRVHVMLAERFGSVPHVMFGHSMGSFILRTYLGQCTGRIDAAVVCATGWQPRAALAFGRTATTVIAKVCGWTHRPRLVDSLAIGAYARAFASEEGGELAWLSRDPATHRAYAEDPACGFTFSCAAYHELFRLIGMAQDPRIVRRMPPDLPVLLISGTADPVGSMGRAAPKVAALMRSCGARDVELKMYPGARHELLNETNRQQVMDDVANWLARKAIPAGGLGAEA